MKFRTDFVTNSSSSSFVYMDIKSPLLVKMFKDYHDVLKERGELSYDWMVDEYAEEEGAVFGMPLYLELEDGLMSIGEDEYDGFAWIPTSLDQVIPSLRKSLSEEAQNCGTRIAPLLAAMLQNEKALTDSIESVSWSHTDQGWGGDHEGRFYPDSLPQDFVDSVWEEIAEDKGVSVEDLTDDDWFEYVANETSVEETSFSYNRETGEESYENSYSFL